MLLLKDNRVRMILALVAFYILLAIYGLDLLCNIIEYNFIYQKGVSGTTLALVPVLDSVFILLAFIIGIFSIIFSILWFRRSFSNLHKLSTDGLTFREGWAAWGWFIPVANLYIPWQIMKELWIGYHKYASKPETNKGLKRIGWWWGCYLAACFLAYKLQIGNADPEALSHLRGNTMLTILYDITSLVSIILIIRIIYSISAIEQALYKEQFYATVKEKNDQSSQ